MAAVAQIADEASLSKWTGFSSEFRLLLASCMDSAALPGILRSPIDWELALKYAEHHRVMPALYPALDARSDVPASIQSALRSRFERHAIKALRFAAELGRVLNAFADAGIEALAYKGPALAVLLYGDPAMRQYGDLDVLVRAQDVQRAKSVLKQLGYFLPVQLSARQERAYLRSGNHYVFGLGREPNLLELHWQIMPAMFAIDFDVDAVFRRAAPVNVCGFPCRTLGREDLFLALCAHAAKHAWCDLGQLCDIAKMAEFDLDWEWIRAEAVRLGMNRIVLLCLRLLSELFGSPEEKSYHCIATRTHNPSEKQKIESVLDTVVSRLARAEDVNTSSMPYFREFLQIRERPRDQLRVVTRRALMPSAPDWQRARLPESLRFLYPLVRVARLAKQFG